MPGRPGQVDPAEVVHFVVRAGRRPIRPPSSSRPPPWGGPSGRGIRYARRRCPGDSARLVSSNTPGWRPARRPHPETRALPLGKGPVLPHGPIDDGHLDRAVGPERRMIMPPAAHPARRLGRLSRAVRQLPCGIAPEPTGTAGRSVDNRRPPHPMHTSDLADSCSSGGPRARAPPASGRAVADPGVASGTSTNPDDDAAHRGGSGSSTPSHLRPVELMAGRPALPDPLARPAHPDRPGQTTPTTCGAEPLRRHRGLAIGTGRVRAAHPAARPGRSEATIKDYRPRPVKPTGLRQRLEVTETLQQPPASAALWGSSGPVGRRIAAVAGRRPLREVLEVRTRRHPFSLRAAGCEVAEVALDDTTIVVGAGERPVQLRRVEVEVVAEWVDVLGPLVEELRAANGLAPATLSKFEAGLLAAGLEIPGAPDLGCDHGGHPGVDHRRSRLRRGAQAPGRAAVTRAGYPAGRRHRGAARHAGGHPPPAGRLRLLLGRTARTDAGAAGRAQVAGRCARCGPRPRRPARRHGRHDGVGAGMGGGRPRCAARAPPGAARCPSAA